MCWLVARVMGNGSAYVDIFILPYCHHYDIILMAFCHYPIVFTCDIGYNPVY